MRLNSIVDGSDPAGRRRGWSAGLWLLITMVATAPLSLFADQPVDRPVDANGDGEAEAMIMEADLDGAMDVVIQPGMQPQFLLNGVVNQELAFVRLVCDVPAEERPKIKAAAMQAAEKKLGANGKGPGLGGLVLGGGVMMAPGQVDGHQLRQAIQEGIKVAVKKHLSSETSEEFERELSDRIEHERLTIIRLSLAMWDDSLRLTESQRTKLEKRILENWRPGFEQWEMYSRFGGQYLPPIPDDLFNDALNPKQQELRRGAMVVQFGVAQEGVNEPDDPWWDGAE